MTIFTKDEECYIEHEVQLRLHDSKFQNIDKAIQSLDTKIDRSVDRLEASIEHLDNKIDSSIKHLDNKFMLMFSIILGSIWIPFVVNYLHLLK